MTSYREYKKNNMAVNSIYNTLKGRLDWENGVMPGTGVPCVCTKPRYPFCNCIGRVRKLKLYNSSFEINNSSLYVC